ncbi:MAG TPA: beta-propeller domain-containing protein, partial [Polyangia bacterium]|nr:beta-propeller domain-containing protein [Polyangia bacterium]
LSIPGTVWNILPAPSLRLFALGSDYSSSSNGDSVSLKYLDVTNPSSPQLIGTSTFGQGWAWTPAAGTFKAFTMDATQGLVVLPFSGWSNTTQTYNDGLQLIDFTASSIATDGAALTRGWVERGIFVKNRLVSLSDLSLSVVDYSNRTAPAVTAELTLARNVITAQPEGSNIAEISSDWWDNDVSWSEVRLLPIANAEETSDLGTTPTVRVDGVNAQVFMNGSLAYIVTNVRVPAVCDTYGRPTGPAPDPTTSPCYGRAEQIQVVDLSNGVRLRGKIQLPMDPWGWYGWGWGGCWYYDWFWGGEVAQVEGNALAFRRWEPIYDPTNGTYIDSNSALWVVDLANPDAPAIASTTIVTDAQAWWGNMQVVGNVLYTGHYEWLDRPSTNGQDWTVRYFADRIDLSDRAHPRVSAKINVPGLLVGGSAADPNLLYVIDYRWDPNTNIARDEFNVVRVGGNFAELVSTTTLDGWVGSTFVRGNVAYMSAEQYADSGTGGSTTGPTVNLHAIDLTDPSAPVDRVSTSENGWGWLLDIEGDRAVLTSGWGANGVDIYQLTDGQAPQFRQFTRTLGWWSNGVSRQDDTLYLSSGYWGVQKIDLK